ncbi:MAG TPA: hypothetical protein VK742_14300 [Candidatus Sulfotelmatobacter sp.]|nr:hypothetical protein [Candidatus Sulfotelmatobacter sp.]
MKTIRTYLSVLALAAMSGFAQGNAQSGDTKTAPPPPRAVFTQPTNSHEGRDPFWPDSNRVFDSNVPVHNAAAVEPTTLKVDGYSIVGGRPIIIINKVSFLAGDEADLPSDGGGHTHVRCVEIHSDYVEVEVNGQRREIRF